MNKYILRLMFEAYLNIILLLKNVILNIIKTQLRNYGSLLENILIS
jgi:hypothetical protein